MHNQNGVLNVSSVPEMYRACVLAQSFQLYLILCDPMDCSSSVCGDSPGKNTGMGSHALLQGIFPTASLTSPALAGTFFTTSAT